MGPAPCTQAHAGKFTLERRRSDFERDARVTPFTGSCCCCCCCLHWLGAAIGGGIGMRMGWNAAEKRLGKPLPQQARENLSRSIAVGVALSITLLIVAGLQLFGELGMYYLVAVALVPPVAFIPICLPMFLSTARLRRKQLSAFRREIAKLPVKEGANTSMSLYREKLTPAPKTFPSSIQFTVFCRACWFDLEESMHLTHCPKCDAPIVDPGIAEPEYGMSVAWRATWTGLGISSLATVGCYAIMYAIALLIK